MKRIATALLMLTLVACGGPSAEQLEATITTRIETAVPATMEAQVAGTATAIAENDCSDAALAQYSIDLTILLDRYDNQVAVANSTPRVGLGPALQAMLEYEDEARVLVAPRCLIEYHSWVIVMMSSYREQLQAFAAQNEIDMLLKQISADHLKKQIVDGLLAIQSGAMPAEIRPLSAATPTP